MIDRPEFKSKAQVHKAEDVSRLEKMIESELLDDRERSELSSLLDRLNTGKFLLSGIQRAAVGRSWTRLGFDKSDAAEGQPAAGPSPLDLLPKPLKPPGRRCA
jgi:hypothetical protein